jgi:hypothetical protein
MDDASAFRLDDFDRDVEEKSIPEEDYPAAFARWIVQRTGGRADGCHASRRSRRTTSRAPGVTLW